MATGQQMTLARHRTPISHVQRPTRQVVPAFLQKLYEMVNDPNNHDLIRWSEAGDSFFVLDHERFAREVLGRWFKHQNFSSFVRQLNMYGFHKIPHLQQGVLRSDTDTEFWNFAHANFHRGQPDLLYLIQRKKQSQTGEDVALDGRDPGSGAGAGGALPSNLSSNQLLDIQSIVSGIAAIKRHQTTISTELNELKRSNQLLWQDAMEARAKHQKQQDTINRIVKFLAGVFGNRTNQHHKEDIVDSLPAHAVVPRRNTRLMIEDGRVAKVGVVEGENVSGIKPADSSIISQELYPTIETPQSAPSPTPSESTSTEPSYLGSYAQSTSPSTTSQTSTFSPYPDHPVAQPASIPSPIINNSTNHHRAVTPTRGLADASNISIQSILSQLSNAQIQQLLTSLASQPIDSISPSGASAAADPSSQLTSYQPPFDFSQYLSMLSSAPSPGPAPGSPPPPPIPATQPPPTEGLISFDGGPHTAETFEKMDREWKAAEDIDKDVNALNTSISSFIQNLGLDPHLLETASDHGQDEDADMASVLPDPSDATQQPQQQPQPNPLRAQIQPPSASASGITGMGSTPMSISSSPSGATVAAEAETEAPVQDFDFDSFLNTFSNNVADFQDPSSAAFLDEVPPPPPIPPAPALAHASTSIRTTVPAETPALLPSDGPESPIARVRTLTLQPQELHISVPAPAPNGSTSTKAVAGTKRKSDVSDLEVRGLGIDMGSAGPLPVSAGATPVTSSVAAMAGGATPPALSSSSSSVAATGTKSKRRRDK